MEKKKEKRNSPRPIFSHFLFVASFFSFLSQAQLFHSLISFKEKNGGKQGGGSQGEGKGRRGKKRGWFLLVAEWMRLLGRNYFETDENFMRFGCSFQERKKKKNK